MKQRRGMVIALLFGAFVLLLAAGLRHNPRILPSALIGQPAPAFSLPSLSDEREVSSAQDLRGGVTLLNVWASWCTACRAEHEMLKTLATDRRIRLIGLNYKDRPADARRWLDFFGNPYVQVAVDADGRVGMNYGVYGVPETFLIDAAGVIRLRHVGPIDGEALQQDILPMINAMGRSG